MRDPERDPVPCPTRWGMPGLVREAAFEMADVHFAYGDLQVLRGFNLSAARNEFVCLFGPSGIGKTTILNLLAGILKPRRGSILMPECRIGYVFQEPRLLPWCDALENIAIGLYARGASAAQRTETASAMARRLELDGFERCLPAQMSGGMRQRVALGRAFAIDPDLLLLDEPFAALDDRLKVSMRSLLLELVEWKRCTAVFVTHDAEEAARMGDRVVILGGRPCRIVREVIAGVPRARRTSEDVQRLAKAIVESVNGGASPGCPRREMES